MFRVEDYDALLSDKHCAVLFSIILQANEGCANVHMGVSSSFDGLLSILPCDGMIDPTQPKRWRHEKANEFTANINAVPLSDLVKRATNLSIEELSSTLNSIMLDAATTAFGVRKHPPPKSHSNKKPIKFTLSDEAKAARKAYHKAKAFNNKNRSVSTKAQLLEKSRAYKKHIQRAHRVQREEFITSLRQLKSKDPKQYWNALQGKKADKSPISLEDFYQHFKKLSEKCHVDVADGEIIFEDFSPQNLDTSALNAPFTADELLVRIRQLKNGKAAGADYITNEFIKNPANELMPLYLCLFNKILESGHVPEDWLVGMIKPLFKNKGDKLDCNNYRGITLLSCVGKLFTSSLNARLYDFCEANDIINETQAGFRSGYSTTDHLFVLHCLIELFITKGKKLYVGFVDYAKAFDTVSHEALWYKLQKIGIEGKILKVVKSLYTNIKSCVTLNGQRSYYFMNLRGVRQGENLSPLLFSLFINDIEEFLINRDCNHISLDDSTLDNYMKLLVLLYADDTTLLADTPAGLQRAFDALHDYCSKWQLNVNSQKTKVLVFSRRKALRHKLTITYNGSTLEQVFDYKYLGVTMNYNGSFKKAIKSLCDQATRAMYALLSKCRKFGLPIDLQIELFDSLVQPILLYNCEVWGAPNIEIVERLHLKFLKYVLGVKKSTCNAMVYGELGRYPLAIKIKKQMIAYWAKLLHGKPSKLSTIMLKCLHDHEAKGFRLPTWLSHIKNILDQCGLSYVWATKYFPSDTWLKSTVEQILKDQFLQSWRQDLADKSSCYFYMQVKETFSLESYLLFSNSSIRNAICRLRTNNSRLPIVTGRYRNLARHERICPLCDSNSIGDEYHLMVECSNRDISSKRHLYLPKHILVRPSVFKCIEWLKSASVTSIKKLGCFLRDTLPLHKL
jgi:sorting nexin-29